MTYEQLHSRLSKEEFSSIYLLYGEETYLIDQSLKLIKEKVLQGGLEDLNLDVFYGRSTEMGTVVDTIEQLPMMAAHRLVILREFQDLREAELQKLMPHLQEPFDSTVVVLVATQLDKRKKHAKKLLSLSHVTAVEYKRPYENEIPRWIDRMAKDYQLQLSSQARSFFHQAVGNNLDEIAAELRKLSQFVGEKQKVELKDIKEVVSYSRVDSVFELTNAIGAGQIQKSFSHLNNLIENGQSEVGISALVARHLRILSMVKEGRRQGTPDRALSSQLGVSPYFLKDYISQSEKWSREKLQKTTGLLADLDRDLKSSSMPPRLCLENFLMHCQRL